MALRIYIILVDDWGGEYNNNNNNDIMTIIIVVYVHVFTRTVKFFSLKKNHISFGTFFFDCAWAFSANNRNGGRDNIRSIERERLVNV